MTNIKKGPEQPLGKQTIEDAIAKTGFVLEHKVASLFEKSHWTIIHNRYYLDDVTDGQREMDMIAYKVREKNGVLVYTVLIISCKKNIEFDWVFLTRNAPGMSVNIKMLPVNIYSNIEEFNYQFSNIDWTRKKFIDKYDKTQIIDKMYNYDKVVFAYQEIKKSSNAASNDTNIYNSIASLIKAQSYEIKSLKAGRKKINKVVYNINLVSIAEIGFHELHYGTNEITTSSISRINYINRFLINTEETYSKIDFVNFDILPNVLSEYDALHSWNIEFYEKLDKDFFTGVFSSAEKSKIVIEKIKEKLFKYINWYAEESPHPSFDYHFFFVDKDKDTVRINITDNNELNSFLNSHNHIKNYTKKLLKDYFRYAGKFTFHDDLLPF
jgi:hypothetical protein